MRKSLAAGAAAGTLLAGLAAASPALAVQGDSQLCSPSTNGGTMVNGVCVLPALIKGLPAEEFLLNSGGGVDVWTIVSGAIPPGMQAPARCRRERSARPTRKTSPSAAGLGPTSGR